MADVFELNQQIIFAEEFGPKNYNFFGENIMLDDGSWMKDLSQLIDAKCRDAITVTLNKREMVIEVFKCLVRQNDINKYKMFIEIWKEHAPAKATQFERALLKRIEDQYSFSHYSLYQDLPKGVNIIL